MSDNYIYIGCGYILNETVNPVLSSSTYYISNTAVTGCNLRYQNENILAVYKNGNYDPNWTIGTTTPYGVKMASCPQASFDVNSTYSVDYIMLATTNTTPTSIATSYQSDILSAVESLAETVENRQTKDSALDSIIDLSVYEEIQMQSNMLPTWVHVDGLIYMYFNVPYKVTKKCVPIVSIQNLSVYYGTGASAGVSITDKVTVIPLVNKSYCAIRLTISDATAITNIKTYGAYIYGKVILDCRGRI